MRKRRYPLEEVLAQRVRACQQAELELMAARGKHHDAQQALSKAQAAADEHRSKRSRLVTSSGPTTAQALACTGAYAARLHHEGQKLAAVVQSAQTVLSAQARAVRLAELTWQRAYVEREALERHHERFRAEERKAIERAYELETEEYAHPGHNLQVR
jgi:hypothetical protein